MTSMQMIVVAAPHAGSSRDTEGLCLIVWGREFRVPQQAENQIAR